MSGCAVCVYDLYLSDLEDFQLSLASARKAIMARLDALPAAEKERRMKEWPDELGDKPGEGVVGKEGGVDAKREAEKELERERKTLDPTVRCVARLAQVRCSLVWASGTDCMGLSSCAGLSSRWRRASKPRARTDDLRRNTRRSSRHLSSSALARSPRCLDQ